MLRLFLDNLLPIFLVSGAGYAVVRLWNVDPRGTSQVAFFVLAPCLVFRLITGNELGAGDALRMAGLATAGLLATAALAALIGRVCGWRRSVITAVTLCALLPNAGNFGLSAVLFAFGETALAHATVYFVVSSVLTFTVGVLVASLGRTSLREAAVGLVRVPALWAVAAALLVRGFDVTLPVPVERSVGLLADASIPTFLVLLGMQLRGSGIHGPLGPLVTATGARLVGGLLTGVVLARLIGLGPAAANAAALQSAMPTAIITIVLATQYDVEPKLVTSVAFATTVLSPLTLTPLLAWLGA